MRSHVDLFSGIGGFSLAARWAGVETIAFAEIDSYASRVLERHFFGVRNYGDVRDVPAIEGVWLVTGGVPCQPASVAGKRRGAEDDRWLWPEALAAVERIRPAWVLFENPTGILSLNDGVEFERICTSLEGQGYEVQPLVIPACGVGAWHKRNRVWVLAHAVNGRPQERRPAGTRRMEGRSNGRQASEDLLPKTSQSSDVAHATSGVRQWETSGTARHSTFGGKTVCDAPVEGLPDWASGTMGQPRPLTEFERPDGREVERDFCGIPHGVSRRVDRLKCLGNSIVPQVAFQLIKRMIEADER